MLSFPHYVEKRVVDSAIILQVSSFKNYITLFFLDTCSESPGSLETGEDDRARSSDASACILCD
jgi:hypothetical protein